MATTIPNRKGEHVHYVGSSIEINDRSFPEDTPRELSPVQSNLSTLTHLVFDISGQVNVLEEKLASVTRPPPNMTQGSIPKSSNEDSVPLVNQLGSVNVTLSAIVQHLDSLLSRIDL